MNLELFFHRLGYIKDILYIKLMIFLFEKSTYIYISEISIIEKSIKETKPKHPIF